MNLLEEKKIEQAAKELVERTRLGDQVAEATLRKMGANARKGNPRALVAEKYAMAAIKSTPPKARVGGFLGSSLGKLRDKIRKVANPKEYAAHVVATVPDVGSSVRDASNAAQAISRGPSIGGEILKEVQAAFGAENEQKAFSFGVRAPVTAILAKCPKCNPGERRAMQVGYSLGLARRLQAGRRGNIAAFSPRAHWELT